MIREFKNLSEEEARSLIDAPVLVSLLIAGADEEVDEKEKDKSIKIAHFRAQNPESILKDYYAEVDKYFEQSFSQYMESLPKDSSSRNHFISSRLEKLNEILPKLDNEFACEFYKSLVSYAKRVAEASGGVLGYGSVNAAESEWMDLKMINPPVKE